MKLIKISPQFQLTIPKSYRHLCSSGWLSVEASDGVVVLRPVQIKEAQTDKEILDELTLGKF
jgi:hypothetical protein